MLKPSHFPPVGSPQQRQDLHERRTGLRDRHTEMGDHVLQPFSLSTARSAARLYKVRSNGSLVPAEPKGFVSEESSTRFLCGLLDQTCVDRTSKGPARDHQWRRANLSEASLRNLQISLDLVSTRQVVGNRRKNQPSLNRAAGPEKSGRREPQTQTCPQDPQDRCRKHIRS